MSLPELPRSPCWRSSGFGKTIVREWLVYCSSRGCAGMGAGAGSNPGCGVRLQQPPLACQHAPGASQLKGAVGSLGSDCHLLPVNSWSSPSLLYKVCHLCPVAGSRMKISAVSLKLGRLVPAAGMWPVLASSTPRALDIKKPALLP